MILPEPAVRPPRDKQFRPAALAVRAFLEKVRGSNRRVPLRLAVEREGGLISAYETEIFEEGAPGSEHNVWYAERLIKSLLWGRGGWRVVVGTPARVGKELQQIYSESGRRAFDSNFMARVYEHPFTVETVGPDDVPAAREHPVRIGRHWDGCRIGLDLGASDRKVSAVIDGEAAYTEEIIWDPQSHSDPGYHYHQIQAALHTAASHMPRTDAIGVSSAGVYISNRARVASLFRGIAEDGFESEVAGLFIRIGQEWKVPLVVANDGDVTALAGTMALEDSGVLGVAMGSSQAAGFVDAAGNITGWLNELAFAPVEWRRDAPVDEWSGDAGVGAQYFSQQAVFRLCREAGIEIDPSRPKADQLKQFQSLLEEGDPRAVEIMETIGCYMGYGVAYYDLFYQPKHILILGRVTSGRGGSIILEKGREVLRTDFPDLAKRVQLHLPEEESARRIGQAVAAASLPARKGD